MPRFLLTLIEMGVLTASPSAQSLFYVVGKVRDYSQINTSTTSLNSGIGYTFNAEIITIPNNSTPASEERSLDR